MISMTVKGNEVLVSIEGAEKATKKGIRIAFHEIGAENRRHARKLIRTGKRSGRTYIIKGKRHRASAVGEVPANLTGNLARKVFYRVPSWYKMEFGDDAEYAQYLEPIRPFLLKTIEDRNTENINIVAHYTDKEIKK